MTNAIPFSLLTNGFILKGCKSRSPVPMNATGHPVAATLEGVKKRGRWRKKKMGGSEFHHFPETTMEGIISY